MQINKIEFDEGEEGATPVLVTVTMPIEEATWIAKQAGKQTAGNPVSGEIYRTLVSDLFNRYWDDGVDEAVRNFLSHNAGD